MKTTLDIADPLLNQVRKIALRDGDTLRSLVEQGLRKVVAERGAKVQPFALQDCSVGVRGARSAYETLHWRDKRALIYTMEDGARDSDRG